MSFHRLEVAEVGLHDHEFHQVAQFDYFLLGTELLNLDGRTLINTNE